MGLGFFTFFFLQKVLAPMLGLGHTHNAAVIRVRFCHDLDPDFHCCALILTSPVRPECEHLPAEPNNPPLLLTVIPYAWLLGQGPQ